MNIGGMCLCKTIGGNYIKVLLCRDDSSETSNSKAISSTERKVNKKKIYKNKNEVFTLLY